MSILDYVLIILGLLTIFGIIFIMIWEFIVVRICNHYVYLPQNKIQWKCVEYQESSDKFRNHEIDYHLCNVYYRIIPSQLNLFVQWFGENRWVNDFDKLKFKNKEEFQDFVKDLITYQDIQEYLGKENRVWYHP